MSRNINGINLGKLLIDFLTFFAHFDPESTGIYACLPGKKQEKPNFYDLLKVNICH